jgi:PKHD-type hydroxylase
MQNQIKSYNWYLKSFPITNSWVHFENVFSEEQIDKIIQIGLSEETAEKQEGKVGGNISNGKVDTSIRDSNISWIRADVTSNDWIFKTLVDVVEHVNKEYFNFDLVQIESLQFTSYDGNKKGKYTSHVDTLSGPVYWQRKLSFSIQLSDENSYKGGNLNLHTGDEKGPVTALRKKGSITFFPSYTLHEVTPVTKGIRYSLVGWVIGPKFV